MDSHDLKRLILIQHQDCGWYKDLPFHLHSSPEPRQRQEEDLRRARAALAKERPELSVELYYAGWDASQHITIDAVYWLMPTYPQIAWHGAMALLMGLLIGLEREHSQRGDEPLFAGVRTFPIIVLSGYLSGLLTQAGFTWVLPVALGGDLRASW